VKIPPVCSHRTPCSLNNRLQSTSVGVIWLAEECPRSYIVTLGLTPVPTSVKFRPTRLFRPTPSVSPYRTPVRGLYIGSAATFPGGAVHGVPGHAAAQVALLESRVRR